MFESNRKTFATHLQLNNEIDLSLFLLANIEIVFVLPCLLKKKKFQLMFNLYKKKSFSISTAVV